METSSLTPDQLEIIKLLIRKERHRIEEQSPDAIANPYPGPWVAALQQLGAKLECYRHGPGF